ncbi:MAG: hypothetical protein BGO61_06800 [Thiobacillus sp. 65-69]|nr:MAG: hypothetical protein ABT21_02400 [Thiobacillus sp. SCN 65-179]OJW35683.1 MAG: hypothetical protein BGO61_06800 [Thiobacillus sp. 65-69]
MRFLFSVHTKNAKKIWEVLEHRTRIEKTQYQIPIQREMELGIELSPRSFPYPSTPEHRFLRNVIHKSENSRIVSG